MAAELEEEQHVGAEMLDRSQFDGIFIPRTFIVDEDVVAAFRRDMNESTTEDIVKKASDIVAAATKWTDNTKAFFQGAFKNAVKTVEESEEGYQKLVGPREVKPENYKEQVDTRRAIARDEFRDMIVRTSGMVTRRTLAYFLGLGLSDVMVDDNPVPEPTVLAMLCKNPDVSSSSVRLAASMLDDVDFDAACEATNYLTPLGLAIVAAVRAQETDAKMSTFGDNAVEKVRVLIEHDSWVCQIPKENSRGGNIEIPEFIERLSSGKGNVESLDLVAIDKLRTIAEVQKKKRDAVIKSRGGGSSTQFGNIQFTNQAQNDPIKTHAIEVNPVYDAFVNAINQGQIEEFFELLKTKQNWDVYVDSVDNSFRLPLIWRILKQLTLFAKDQMQTIKFVLGENLALRPFCPAFDLLLHWYLSTKQASNAFKFDSLACVFWYCVGSWRLFGADDYDIDLNETYPFPMMNLSAPAKISVADDTNMFRGNFFYSSDENVVKDLNTRMGLSPAQVAETNTKNTLISNLQLVIKTLYNRNFVPILEESITKIDNLTIPDDIARLSFGQTTFAAASQQSGFDMASVRLIRKIPGTNFYEGHASLMEYLSNSLRLPAQAKMTRSDFFSDLSLMMVSGTKETVAANTKSLHDALIAWDGFYNPQPANEAILLVVMDDKTPFQKNTSVNTQEVVLNRDVTTYAASAIFTVFQYGVLERLARFSHQNIIRFIADVRTVVGTITSAPIDMTMSHLQTMFKLLINFADEFTFYRIVTGSIALTLGVMEKDNNKSLAWGKEIGRISKILGASGKSMVGRILERFLRALTTFRDSGVISQTNIESLNRMRTTVEDRISKILEHQNTTQSLVGNSVTMASVSLKMPFSADDVAPSYQIQYTAEIFKLLASFPTAFKTHVEHIFANPTDFSNRLDMRNTGDIWPQIPGALM